MTRSTTKKLAEPLDEPEREFHRRRRATWHQQQNESLAIAGRNLFDDEASSSTCAGVKSSTLLKTFLEPSLPNSIGFQNPIILPSEQTGNIVNSRDILLIQGACTFQGLESETQFITSDTTLVSWTTYNLVELQKIRLGYASSTFSLKEKQNNGLIKYLPSKSQHRSSSSHDSSITSSRPAVPRSYETRSFDSNKELTNPSKAPGSVFRI
ncbi:hypothetical protein Tco_1332634 [Tanacetum coccineum]